MARLRRILVATDMSKAGNTAIAQALDLAVLNDARLYVCSVIPDLPLTDEEMMMLRVNLDEVRTYNQKKLSEARLKLEKLISPAQKQRGKIEFVIRDGKPAQEILAFAEQIRADLIVLASNSHHGFAELLLGSTTDRVVHKAPCSVLVVREKGSHESRKSKTS